jgi:hypothetical protein
LSISIPKTIPTNVFTKQKEKRHKTAADFIVGCCCLFLCLQYATAKNFLGHATMTSLGSFVDKLKIFNCHVFPNRTFLQRRLTSQPLLSVRPITSACILNNQVNCAANTVKKNNLPWRGFWTPIVIPHLFLNKKHVCTAADTAAEDSLDDDGIETLRKREYQQKMAKQSNYYLFSRFVRAVKWFQTKYGHLDIGKNYQLPQSDEEALDEDIKGYLLGISLDNIRCYAIFTKEPFKSQLIELGILPEPSPVSATYYISSLLDLFILMLL